MSSLSDIFFGLLLVIIIIGSIILILWANDSINFNFITLHYYEKALRQFFCGNSYPLQKLLRSEWFPKPHSSFCKKATNIVYTSTFRTLSEEQILTLMRAIPTMININAKEFNELTFNITRSTVFNNTTELSNKTHEELKKISEQLGKE